MDIVTERFSRRLESALFAQYKKRITLGLFAAKYSRARVFIPVILYLDNVLQTKRPICIPALDMSMRYHYESFVYQDTNSKFQIRDFESRVGAYGTSWGKGIYLIKNSL